MFYGPAATGCVGAVADIIKYMIRPSGPFFIGFTLNEFISGLIEEKIMNHFYSISLVEISWEINKEDISYLVDNLLNIINNSDVIKHHALELCKTIYAISVNNIDLNSILNRNTLEEDMRKQLNLLLENKDFNDHNKIIVDDILEKLLDNKIEFISEEFKSYISEECIIAILNTIEKNIIPILRSLDLQSITLEEVDEMHPKEIHDLFKSFAGDFFIRLYIYGGFGLIFGVNVYLSIVLFIIDMIYTKKVDSKLKESPVKLFKE